MIELVAGTANPDKLVEIAKILEPHAVLLPRPEGLADVVEDADTLEGNARLKAIAVAAAAGRAAVADDTGLEVDALGGAPGVWSARFAGENATYEDNVAKLLADLDGVPADKRTARFRTVAMVAWPDGRELVANGVCEGTILTERRGQGGFGYDPVFQPVGFELTFAEMNADDKNAMSHRGRALHQLRDLLASQD